MILDRPLLELNQLVHGQLNGNPSHVVRRLLPIQYADVDDISFVSEQRYVKAAAHTKASVLIVSKHLDVSFPTTIVVENASLAVNKLVAHFSSTSTPSSGDGVHPSAVI